MFNTRFPVAGLNAMYCLGCHVLDCDINHDQHQRIAPLGGDDET